MTNPYPISYQSSVTLHLSIHLEDGTEVESTFGGEPLRFVIGDGTLHPGLELGLYGLREGDRQTLRLHPEQHFGYRDPAKLRVMQRSEFPDEIIPAPGQVIAFTTPEGEEVAGSVLEVEGDEVKVDFSHPLAGHEITFTVQILEIVPAQVEE